MNDKTFQVTITYSGSVEDIDHALHGQTRRIEWLSSRLEQANNTITDLRAELTSKKSDNVLDRNENEYLRGEVKRLTKICGSLQKELDALAEQLRIEKSD